jgi:cytochrome c556
MRFPKLLVALLLPLAIAACGEPADTRPGQPVAHRRAAFEKILHAFEPMGVQLRKKQYKPESFLTWAKELAAVKSEPWKYFSADTNYPPTHATPKVWSEPEQFEKEQQTFLAAADALVVAAESSDENKVALAYEAVHDHCRSCHKVFKEQ